MTKISTSFPSWENQSQASSNNFLLVTSQWRYNGHGHLWRNPRVGHKCAGGNLSHIWVGHTWGLHSWWKLPYRSMSSLPCNTEYHQQLANGDVNKLTPPSQSLYISYRNNITVTRHIWATNPSISPSVTLATLPSPAERGIRMLSRPEAIRDMAICHK